MLIAVERGTAHSDELLRGHAVSALSNADRGLATALVLGVLRWRILLDHELQQLLARPGAKVEPEVRIALCMGAFQLLRMDRIPAHAAIDESVELAKHAGHHFAARMVNAVLRKLAASPRTELPESNAKELALAQAHPAWMVERWTKFYGIEVARAISRYGQEQPAQTVRIADGAVEAELVQVGMQLEPGTLLSAARTVVSGEIALTAASLAGRVRFQDEGSQLVAEMAADPERKIGRILDACAAPGGKTLILAERHPAACIVAFESNPQRLAALRKRLAPLGDRVACRLADATALQDESAYDLVLADVPCSGTGTLGRNPEIRHRLAPEDLARQAERQKAILRAALHAVRPGGRVVYSTCSLEPEENEEVVPSVLAQAAHVRVVPARERIDAMLRAGALTAIGAERLRGCVTREGCLRLLPGAYRTDGFFLAILERTA